MKFQIATARRPHQNAGFTLVELLVALGLVSILLLMFAQVFQIATGTMSTQRGLMENDQRARAITTIMTNDLNNRSMATVMPFTGDEADSTVGGYYSFSQRQGFLSISENDPTSDADDVLHFTMFISPQLSSEATLSDSENLYGRAVSLANVSAHPNQPEADDGSIFLNSTATSNMAEVVYFVRKGKLYRRVLLVRRPLDDADDRQPQDSADNDFFDPMNGYYTTGSFWNDFDFSAQYDTGLGYVQFTGGATTSGLALSGGSSFRSIAKPHYRFGHDPVSGNPREYVNGNADFIGRFTQEETSHASFIYPRAVPTMGIPTQQATALTLNASGVVNEFSTTPIGPRRGEDLLLSNVHGFDVKVWDESVGDYVDVGGSTTIDFTQSTVAPQMNYGPNGPGGNRVFDTWHPQIDLNSDSINDNAPIIPRYATTWVANQNPPYKIGDVVVPNPAFVTNADLAYRVTAVNLITRDAMTGNVVRVQPQNYSTSANLEPNGPNSWATAVGQTTQEDEYQINATNFTQITWTAVPIVKRVKSLKITIRYLDVSSDQMRQVSLIQSLVN